MFELIKAVSDTVLDMISAAYYDKPLLLSGYVSGEARLLPSSDSEYKLLNIFELIKAVSATVLDMTNAVYHDKPLIFIRATFQVKLVSHHQTVNVNC